MCCKNKVFVNLLLLYLCISGEIGKLIMRMYVHVGDRCNIVISDKYSVLFSYEIEKNH